MKNHLKRVCPADAMGSGREGTAGISHALMAWAVAGWVAAIWVLVATASIAMAAPGENLPLAAGLCVNKAGQLVQEEKFSQAVKILKEFQAKAEGLDPEKAASRGYTHYYISFLLGNSLLMQDQKAPDPRLVKEAAGHLSTLWPEKRIFHRPGSIWPGAGIHWVGWLKRPKRLSGGMRPLKRKNRAISTMVRSAPFMQKTTRGPQDF